ncbi:bacillithiol system redox-active protein YtxJ [Geomicrobium sp. JSM 1781026]|uniref:bacillithiol system redox-active protein YtxJ n=1 Tax=Geomicrobium sp. JSM 1781026 TaxID=3344580 RepID=UPI0035C1E0DC
MQQIHEEQQIVDALESNDRVLLFKNSTTCPISSAAFEELRAFDQENSTVPILYLNVQESRELSNYVAKEWRVKHESPQALLINKESAEWFKSHNNITKTSLEEAVN